MAHDHGGMLWRTDAVERVLRLRTEALQFASTERVPVDAIAGRTLAETVVAERDVPERDHATMDGFAFDATEAYPFEVVGEVYPEDDPPPLESGQAVRIATGASLPPEANAVLKREDARVEDGRLVAGDADTDPDSDTGDKPGATGEPAAIRPGTYTYERGSNVAEGERLFDEGERLSPKDAILLRDVGVEDVSVRERFAVGSLATGTEIHEGRLDDLDSPMLLGLVRAWGHEATHEGTVPDDYDRVEGRIRDLAREYDVVLTTGGTSVGKKDYVIRALEALGDVNFHRARVRPGKPIAAARLPEFDAHAFAIPGKPVGAHTIATLVMRPFFTGDASLPAVDAELARDVGTGPDGFEYAVPVKLSDRRAEGTGATDRVGKAMPLGHVDSQLRVYEDTFDPSVLSSSTRATRADGFFITKDGVSKGERVRVVPYPVVE